MHKPITACLLLCTLIGAEPAARGADAASTTTLGKSCRPLLRLGSA
jgi:hypothetical protein